jgi:hypothetical protein
MERRGAAPAHHQKVDPVTVSGLEKHRGPSGILDDRLVLAAGVA